MEVEDDNQEGPFTVWQMFNAPTMVLFNNLEHAADGLDRLLTSILKLSGDFSEVLVPRPNSSKFPDEYYKAFNTWLIGRLFYVWSVKELERIHITSKDAQLKILNILSVNGASFYQDIHSEYFNILQQLSEYYKENAENPSTTQKELANFSTGNIHIPNTQLDLQSIYVTVKDLQTCERLIELTLQLLSESIPVSPFHTDQNGNSYETLYLLVLGMLENYNVHVKLCCLNFFHEIIDKSDKVIVTKFSENFPEVYDQFMYCLEAITASMPIYHEKGEVDGIYLEKFSIFMVNMLKKITTTLEDRHKQIVATVCTVILNTAHGKVFNKDLKTFCLSLSSIVDLSEEYIGIRNKDSKELYILMEYFTHNIVSCLTNDAKDLKGNSHYQMLLCTVVESIESAKQNVTSHKYDKFLLLYQLNRVVAALTILQNIYLKHQAVSNKAANEKVQLLSEDNTKKILANVVTLHAALKTDVIHDIEIATALMEISVLVATRSQNVSSSTMSQVVKILQITEYSDDIRINALKYYTIVNVILKKKLDDGANKAILSFVSTLTRSKTSSTYKQIISACPILLLKKTFSESKLIAEILLPAFLMKDADIHKELCKVLPILACMSLGNCAVVLQTKEEIRGHVIYSNNCAAISIVCSKCHNTNRTKLTPEQFLAELGKDSIVFDTETTQRSYNDSTLAGQRSLFAKFLNSKIYSDLADSGFLNLVEGFSNHGVFNLNTVTDVFSVGNSHDVLKVLRQFIDNISEDTDIDSAQKESIFNVATNLLVDSTKTSLENNDYNHQTQTLNCIKEYGLSKNKKVLLPSTKLLVYFIMHPQTSLGPKAVVYLRDICEAHDTTPNQVYHRYKKDYCKLFVDCSLYCGKEFAMSLLKVVRAFGFVGYRDFISKDVHHFLPYLIPYSVKIKEVPSIIEEIASLVQCSVSDFLTDRFPHIYTHIYLYENDSVAKKCYDLIERLTKSSILNLIRRHFRIILTEFLLQYCCNPEKVLAACRYLACHDPDVSTTSGSTNMSASQVADFLQPKFLGVLAYIDHKLVNAKVALSVKRKALQSFPDIIKLMGVKYLTPLRYKVLATLRSAMSLVHEFPKILAAAWSAFIHNIDSMLLGPLLSNLAVSLLQQMDHAPHEINKIFQYLVLSNENLLSSHISDLFFLQDSNISEKVKLVIKRHVKRTQPEGFLDKIKWYLQHLNQEIPTVKACAFSQLDKLLKSNRTEIHKAIFGGKTIDPIITELIDCLLTGCKDSSQAVSVSSGSCLGQLGAIEAGHLPRQYVQPDRSPFAFSISDDCFAATALVELTRAFQYEKDTMKRATCPGKVGHLPRQYVQPDRSPFAFSISDDCFAATALVELTRAFQYEKDTMYVQPDRSPFAFSISDDCFAATALVELTRAFQYEKDTMYVQPDRSPFAFSISDDCFAATALVELTRAFQYEKDTMYVQPDRSPFAFSISDDCFAATPLVELSRAFQYEKDTRNMDCYALTIQEILKIYNISPNGKKEIWDSFPEHMHQIMFPLLSSRYTLAYPSQPKKAHPLFGSAYATTFLEWAHNWAGQLIPLIESESIRALVRAVHPSMRRDARTLLLLLPHVLLHAVMSRAAHRRVHHEMQAVIVVVPGLAGGAVHPSMRRDARTLLLLLPHVLLHAVMSRAAHRCVHHEMQAVIVVVPGLAGGAVHPSMRRDARTLLLLLPHVLLHAVMSRAAHRRVHHEMQAVIVVVPGLAGGAVHPSMRRDARTLLLLLPHVLLHAVMSRAAHRRVHHEMQAVIGLENFENPNRVTLERSRYKLLRHIRMTPSVSSVNAEEGNQYKCSKMVYTLLDFLKRWLMEWCHSKQHPLQNENYKAISSFLDRFDKLTIARGNFLCGEYSRALQYLELHVEENKQQTQPQLPLLAEIYALLDEPDSVAAEIYALLDEPDSVAGILAIKRTEPSLKELILAQVVTGRLQDAALCYERLAQEGQLDRNSLQGMIDCYLGLDQPFTAYRLLSEQDDGDTMELGAEALWRLGRFEELDELAKKPVPPSRENWGLLMGRTLLAYRSQDQEAFDQSCHAAMTRLVSQMDDESKGESALRSGYQSVLGLHIITEAKHAQEVLQRLKSIPDSEAQESSIISELLDEWRLRLCVVQSDVRTVEPLLRTRRILLQQTQELLEPTHPLTASKLKSCIGDLWLQSVKHARKAGIFQQSYMYILNAEEYHPEQLYIEKSKMYWARAQRELAFTSLKRGLDEATPELDKLTQEQSRFDTFNLATPLSPLHGSVIDVTTSRIPIRHKYGAVIGGTLIKIVHKYIEYHPEQLYIEKSKMYWARAQRELAFTSLKRGLDEASPELDQLTQDQRKICAKAKLLIAKYNDETTNVDVDVNIAYYKEAVDMCKQWEKSLVCLGAYYEKVSGADATNTNTGWSRRVYALNSYGKALQYGHKYLYQSMPRMLSIW
ncbi:unnamed protein product [Plutella xylostella]|uniref:non-specific serine/threonine protein kinase n=1 Tax=Plutella xylostella TaxID=51655 RepID=A0A8S4DEM3_PLUXY|nr:unnamed protein product [Plutella xylostella]